MKKLHTSVTPKGEFKVGLHKPFFSAENFRIHDFIEPLGSFPDGSLHINTNNFPENGVEENSADWIYEIPNPFSFRGTTYIVRNWAERNADNPDGIRLPPLPRVSLTSTLETWMNYGILDNKKKQKIFSELPEPLLLALASSSTDPEDLIILAGICCRLSHDAKTDKPIGMQYVKTESGHIKAEIIHHDLFETLVNNPYLPDDLKNIMVLRPGVQGDSEIVGEWQVDEEKSHIFEYLRRNSYIPWGHYASNMANDSIRYNLKELTQTDISGLRHLYYQRTFSRLAEMLGIKIGISRKRVSVEELENIREKILTVIKNRKLKFNGTLWGWNYGFGCAQNGYRQHASHQQIHQQFALLPSETETTGDGNSFLSYGCGDLVQDFISRYRNETGNYFFSDYIKSLYSNKRTDGKENLESSLIVYEDEHTILFVPKAQTSQWELQLMTKKPLGNILETDAAARHSLDTSILKAMKCLTHLGGRMITVIEYSKRFDESAGQHLLYAFLPKLPYAGIAFTEQQLRWICGHYPEDFAESCRKALNHSLNDSA